MENRLAWEKYDAKELKKVNQFAEEYRGFLSECKTERECVKKFETLAKKEGYEDLFKVIKENRKLKAGDKVYATNRGKSIVLFQIGSEPIENGMNILGAHIDSPRIDLKQNPLYEDTGLALFDTHYYGGIKKYQWVTIPLALHGVVALKNGEVIDIVIGEKDTDPVVGISDLLIHLAGEQMEKKGNKIVEGEALDILVGSIPLKDEKNDKSGKKDPIKDAKDKVKANILRILKEKYGIEEEDFISAEIEAVPAGNARNYGIDESMILGYGHDDRVCAYPSYAALMEAKKLKRTGVCILVDKEEIGSVGATGMHSKFFENMVAEVMDRMGEYSELRLRRALTNSKMLSSDVTAAFDPNYPSASEKKNTAYFGRGMVLMKYTGSRGKSGSNDASAEFIGELRRMMDDHHVNYQTSELGKVDQGGGGTIAYILANYGMDVIDCGVAVQNMHAPYEVISKADLYETKCGYKVFLENA
ncbi:MAG: aminopeptidase [Lachnospiraceae bacterium]